MPSERQTYPYDPRPSAKGVSYGSNSVFNEIETVPDNPFAALMEAAPFQDPEESWEEKHQRLEPLRDAMESGLLDDREVWVIEALFWRRVGLRSVGQELSLSKTHVARIRDEAIDKLRKFMTEGTN